MKAIKLGQICIIKDGSGKKVVAECVYTPDNGNPEVAGFGNVNHPIWRKLSEIEDYEERVSFLKESLQEKYDKKNWSGESSLTENERLCRIAAELELTMLGIVWEPVYHCPN